MKLPRIVINAYRRHVMPRVKKLILRKFLLEPEVMIMVDGGLGSQMWQFALGRGIEKKSSLRVSYDTSWYARNGKDINGRFSRKYELEEIFKKIQIEKASEVKRWIYYLAFREPTETKFDFYESILNGKSPRYLGDYFLNAKYIDCQGDELRDLLEFHIELSKEDKAILRKILSLEEAIAVHIRRGDYIGSNHEVTSERYFVRSMKKISMLRPNVEKNFFIFSNDIEWCKQLFGQMDEKIVFVDNNSNDRGAIDMFLMSNCNHFIISNSSFSWWPAWLSRRSPEKIVIMPEKWLANETSEQRFSMKVDSWLIGQC